MPISHISGFWLNLKNHPCAQLIIRLYERLKLPNSTGTMMNPLYVCLSMHIWITCKSHYNHIIAVLYWMLYSSSEKLIYTSQHSLPQCVACKVFSKWYKDPRTAGLMNHVSPVDFNQRNLYWAFAVCLIVCFCSGSSLTFQLPMWKG